MPGVHASLTDLLPVCVLHDLPGSSLTLFTGVVYSSLVPGILSSQLRICPWAKLVLNLVLGVS